MESQAVRRRINTISAHLAAGFITQDVTAPTTSLFPLNCSSNLSTAFRRLDNRLHYGRQASASQGYFARQAYISTERVPYMCKDNSANEEKVTAPTPPLFSRLGSPEPQFARPKLELNCYNTGIIDSVPNDKMLATPKCPRFAEKPITQKKFNSRKVMLPASQTNGLEWLPRINVAESKRNYVITVELPGVNIRDIRVEMDDKNLTVKGRRSIRRWKSEGCSNDSIATYHKREISQGPYQVVWPLPAGANKDSVSAEFVEGLLQIRIPKL